jgi:hypothetical protein
MLPSDTFLLAKALIRGVHHFEGGSHGYTREILERDGQPAIDLYRDFAG